MPEKLPPNAVIIVEPTPTDFVAGAETGFVEIARNALGNWVSSEPPGEWQRDMASGFETDACVSFGADDTLETTGDADIKAGRLPQPFVDWMRSKGYFNPDGTLNFSDRFTAKMSGTTTNGNSLPAVWASIKKNGLVPESVWPFPFAQLTNDQNADWATYYATVPPEIVALGQEFVAQLAANGLGVFYEWVIATGIGAGDDVIRQALTVSPLHIATAVCPPWNTAAPINGCGPGSAHATMLAAMEVDGTRDILDHYVPFQKRFSPNYVISYAMRGVIQPLYVAPQTFHYTFTKQLTYLGVTNDPVELHALQQALQTVKNAAGQTYMKAGVFGPFGPQTKVALGVFQTDRGIHDIDGQGADFGPASRTALNAALLNVK